MPFLEENLTRAYWRVHNWDYTTFYKRGVASLSLLDDLFAGSLVLMWSKLAPLIRGYRTYATVHDYGLRFEALAKALDLRLTKRGEDHAAFR